MTFLLWGWVWLALAAVAKLGVTPWTDMSTAIICSNIWLAAHLLFLKLRS